MPYTKPKKTSLSSIRFELEITIKAPVDVVWNNLVTKTSKWWPKDFYTSPYTQSFNIEPELGGRMYEKQAAGGGLIWMTVHGIRPPEYLYLVGHICPPFGGPATSLLTIELAESVKRETVLKLQDNSFGQISDDMAKNLGDGWKYLFENCLKIYIEK